MSITISVITNLPGLVATNRDMDTTAPLMITTIGRAIRTDRSLAGKEQVQAVPWMTKETTGQGSATNIDTTMQIATPDATREVFITKDTRATIPNGEGMNR